MVSVRVVVMCSTGLSNPGLTCYAKECETFVAIFVCIYELIIGYILRECGFCGISIALSCVMRRPAVR